MARRSPMNNRYQKGTEPKGVTRKSAASAKPKRAIGEQGSQSSNSKNKKGNKNNSSTTKGAKSLLRAMPDTPEYKRYRKMWWYCLGAALVLLLLSLGLGSESVIAFLGISESVAGPVGVSMTFLAMFMVAYSWYIDLKKIRPLMREFDEGKDQGTSSNKKAKDKADAKAKDKDSDSDKESADADKKSDKSS